MSSRVLCTKGLINTSNIHIFNFNMKFFKNKHLDHTPTFCFKQARDKRLQSDQALYTPFECMKGLIVTVH